MNPAHQHGGDGGQQEDGEGNPQDGSACAHHDCRRVGVPCLHQRGPEGLRRRCRRGSGRCCGRCCSYDCLSPSLLTELLLLLWLKEAGLLPTLLQQKLAASSGAATRCRQSAARRRCSEQARGDLRLRRVACERHDSKLETRHGVGGRQQERSRRGRSGAQDSGQGVGR